MAGCTMQSMPIRVCGCLTPVGSWAVLFVVGFVVLTGSVTTVRRRHGSEHCLEPIALATGSEMKSRVEADVRGGD
jgi:hypothetical protein